MRNPVRQLLVVPILIYQKVISPLFPPRCRYWPSCSHYTKDSILKHGFLKGFFLGLLRIARCNALFSGGVDLVPRGHSWRRILRRVGQDYRRFWSP